MQNVHGIIFPNKTPTAEGFRAMFSSCLLDGIVSGCDLKYNTSANTLTIGKGFYHCAGGEVVFTLPVTVDIPTSNGYHRVKAVIDTSIADSDDEDLPQFSLIVDSSTTIPKFTALTQQNINTDGSKYEAELCLIYINSTTKKIFRASYATPKLQWGSELPDVAPLGSVFLLKV